MIDVNGSSYVLNEMMKVFSENISPAGFEKLEFKGFNTGVRFDDVSLLKLAEKLSGNLKELNMSGMLHG